MVYSVQWSPPFKTFSGEVVFTITIVANYSFFWKDSMTLDLNHHRHHHQPDVKELDRSRYFDTETKLNSADPVLVG